jgi:hypothetical protein
MKFLLNVGAEKAGTTWLYEYFQNHPDFHDMGKELNIIQRDDLVPALEDVDEYRKDLSAFFLEVSMHKDVTGDFTHYEGSSENIFRLYKEGLEKYDIEVVPVYIMRDPIQRAWSAWNMIGGGSTKMSPAAEFVMSNFISCRYKETVQALDSVFPNTMYFFYENFFTQTNINSICDALEISRHPAECDVKVNEGIYSPKIPKSFIKTLGKTTKNTSAVKFINERFSHVPWKLEDYISIDV